MHSELVLTGKDVLQDIREGAPSLPLFMLRERCSEDEWSNALPVLSTSGLLSYSERVLLGTLIDDHSIVKACKDFVRAELAAATTVTEEVSLHAVARVLCVNTWSGPGGQ